MSLLPYLSMDTFLREMSFSTMHSEPMANHPHKAHVLPAISLQHADVAFDFGTAVAHGMPRFLPEQPELPAIGQSVHYPDIHQPSAAPQPLPPLWHVPRPAFLRPEGKQMLGKLALDVLHEPGDDDADLAAGFDEIVQIIQVQVVGAELYVRVETDDGIKEGFGIRQRAGVGVQGKDLLRQSGLIDPLQVLGCRNPQVRRPDLKAIFLR
jgi:hypothetical protein